MPLDINILGEGVYSPSEAARLIGGTAQEILRWTRGSDAHLPLWNAYYQPIDDITELSFSDLIELRVEKKRNEKQFFGTILSPSICHAACKRRE